MNVLDLIYKSVSIENERIFTFYFHSEFSIKITVQCSVFCLGFFFIPAYLDNPCIVLFCKLCMLTLAIYACSYYTTLSFYCDIKLAWATNVFSSKILCSAENACINDVWQRDFNGVWQPSFNLSYLHFFNEMN